MKRFRFKFCFQIQLVPLHFGILKKRFRILRLPFTYHDADDIDAVFKTCCAFHNMILKYDGRDDIGVEDSDWIRADIEVGLVSCYLTHSLEAPGSTLEAIINP